MPRTMRVGSGLAESNSLELRPDEIEAINQALKPEMEKSRKYRFRISAYKRCTGTKRLSQEKPRLEPGNFTAEFYDKHTPIRTSGRADSKPCGRWVAAVPRRVAGQASTIQRVAEAGNVRCQHSLRLGPRIP